MANKILKVVVGKRKLTIQMIKKKLSGSSGLNNLKKRRKSVSGSLSDERSAKIPQRGMKYLLVK